MKNLLLLLAFAFLIAVSNALAPPPLVDVQPVPFRLKSVQTRTTFRYHYLTSSGNVYPYKPNEPYLKIAATNNVNDQALTIAGHTLSKLIKHMPHEVFMSVTKSHGVGIFTMAESLTVFPENSRLADRPECYGICSGSCAITCTFDGRKYATVPGMTNSLCAINSDTILCNSRDPYRRTENIISHEFAHLVHLYAPHTWVTKIKGIYQNAKSNRLWDLRSYAMANEYEYFAEGAEAFYMTTSRTDGPTGGMNMCGTAQACPDERAARAYLKKHDPMLFDALSYFFTNNQPDLPGNMKICMN